MLSINTVTYYNCMSRYVNLLLYSGSDTVFSGQHHTTSSPQWVITAVSYWQLGTARNCGLKAGALCGCPNLR